MNYIWTSGSGRQYLLANKREGVEDYDRGLCVYDVIRIIKDIPYKKGNSAAARGRAYLYPWEDVVACKDPVDLLKEML